MTTGPRYLVLALVVLVVLGSMIPAAAQAGLARRIVLFQDSFVNAEAQAGLVRAFQGHALRSLPIVNGMAVLLPPAAEKGLAHRPEVAGVYEDGLVQAADKPASSGRKPPSGQPPQELPWGVNRIDAEYAWAYSRGAGVTVAVIDTGVDRRHPDLAVAGGVNYVPRSLYKPVDPNGWDDNNGHGTHVAGIIAALDNTIGVVGVAPAATLYAVKVLDKNGSGYVSDVISGINWCAANHIQVANLSLSTQTDWTPLHTACDQAAAAGVLLVAAAGNDGSAVDYPAAYSSVIAVAATDRYDQKASWSSYGPQLALSAPGVGIKSTWPGGLYAVASGTSMAAPHVAGVMALALAAGRTTNLGLSADDLYAPGPDVYSGAGLVDAGEAASGILNLGDDLP